MDAAFAITPHDANINQAARAVAYFAGYALGEEHRRVFRARATDSKVVRVYILAARFGRVAGGTLRVFWRAWRVAEALFPEAGS